jgi:hypothetical protein
MKINMNNTMSENGDDLGIIQPEYSPLLEQGDL